jgi:serine/threonine protein kinase
VIFRISHAYVCMCVRCTLDFGLSRHCNRGEEMHQSVGTPYYIAPEVLEGNCK